MNTEIINTEIEKDIIHVFKAQKSNTQNIANTDVQIRKGKLRKILAWTIAHEVEIGKALFDDFKKNPSETNLGEILGVVGEIKHLLKHLKSWMKPQYVSTPISMIGTSAHVRFEPKGVCLIISPWNYPFNLSIKPLVQAIAAGNTVILKPSELTPNTSTLLKKMISELFEENEVAVFEGDANVSQILLNQPFNHIFFTGSPAIGKIVMSAAAKNLTSVTLELGGKSPCIVDKTANIQKVAEKIAWGKFINNGQTCIAPDYVLVHKSVENELTEALKSAIVAMYGTNAKESADYCRIVNNRHFNRLNGLLQEAIENGAKVEIGGQTDSFENYIAPTLLSEVEDSMKIMEEEIFGPILPIVSFSTNEEAIAHIKSREKPLAMYINSSKESNIKFFMDNTSAGGTVINDCVIHYGHTEIPFGGVNNSGIGKSGGIWGFTEFSNQRGVMRQKFGTFKMIYPPYTPFVAKLIKFFIKYI
ncbi:aldehyde dehydrogenase family protein [Arcicella sp. LKC2W]|uniref:aldehyde dehydrogenase family protein n=1 Tax=Arcicella sp. LKC2W TaxID=2984198 RepID=UPI002B216E1A|nr:aldehyde dehydrogenase family protein [Arcicella sp. LKC2W]MEA5458422.1 aldehyde dehydrogenase family protein [Arcicella sp. LKC2W]